MQTGLQALYYAAAWQAVDVRWRQHVFVQIACTLCFAERSAREDWFATSTLCRHTWSLNPSAACNGEYAYHSFIMGKYRLCIV